MKKSEIIERLRRLLQTNAKWLAAKEREVILAAIYKLEAMP